MRGSRYRRRGYPPARHRGRRRFGGRRRFAGRPMRRRIGYRM